MNNEIPGWWLGVSAAFFVVNLILCVGLVYAVLKLVKFLEEVKPKVDQLQGQVSDLVIKVEKTVERVEEVANSVKETVESVGSSAKGVVGSAEIMAHSASKQVERFSPIVVGIATAFKILRTVQDYRADRKVTHVASRVVKKKPSKNPILALFGK